METEYIVFYASTAEGETRLETHLQYITDQKGEVVSAMFRGYDENGHGEYTIVAKMQIRKCPCTRCHQLRCK